jgi:L-ascorbate metabolism protein UlaG (beta-lactamase superfamily)
MTNLASTTPILHDKSMMKRTFLIPLLLCQFVINSFAQRPIADKIETNKGDLIIQPILHGTLVLQWDGKTIYIDPYGGEKALEGMPNPDLIIITDIHGDHLNMGTLQTVDASNALYIVPQAVAKEMGIEDYPRGRILNNAKSIEEKGIGIEAIPMYNLPEDASSRHTKGRGNGYILTFGDKRVYISGDTEDIPEMRALTDIDVAFVCMNLPYTMDINQAASAVIDFEPAIMYPFHYRGTEGLADVASFKALVLKGTKKTDVRLRNWYPNH